MAELDAETVKQIGMLIGKLEGVSERFDALDEKIDNAHASLHERLNRHEEREEPRLQKIERLTWLGVGGVITLSAVIAFGMNAISAVLK